MEYHDESKNSLKEKDAQKNENQAVMQDQLDEIITGKPPGFSAPG